MKIYADFESVLKGVQSNDTNNNTCYTEKYKKHIPCSFAYKVICFYNKISKPIVFYRGKNILYIGKHIIIVKK